MVRYDIRYPVIILLQLKLIILYFPNVPVCCPLYVAPNDSAASSINIALCLSQKALISSNLLGVPFKFAITTTLTS